jgi:hypothetical protein
MVLSYIGKQWFAAAHKTSSATNHHGEQGGHMTALDQK